MFRSCSKAKMALFPWGGHGRALSRQRERSSMSETDGCTLRKTTTVKQPKGKAQKGQIYDRLIIITRCPSYTQITLSNKMNPQPNIKITSSAIFNSHLSDLSFNHSRSLVQLAHRPSLFKKQTNNQFNQQSNRNFPAIQEARVKLRWRIWDL